MKMEENAPVTRRRFIQTGLNTLASFSLVGLSGYLIGRSSKQELVWQLDPNLCVQCEKCSTDCVLPESAVKAVHSTSMCGYCDLCSGYLEAGARSRDTGAENQLCPTGAIMRTFVENPYFEYQVDEKLCIGCGKCVKGCGAFGNGSLYLQVRHDRCLNCNECAIARVCPAQAYRRVPANQPYLLRGDEGRAFGNAE